MGGMCENILFIIHKINIQIDQITQDQLLELHLRIRLILLDISIYNHTYTIHIMRETSIINIFSKSRSEVKKSWRKWNPKLSHFGWSKRLLLLFSKTVHKMHVGFLRGQWVHGHRPKINTSRAYTGTRVVQMQQPRSCRCSNQGHADAATKVMHMQ